MPRWQSSSANLGTHGFTKPTHEKPGAALSADRPSKPDSSPCNPCRDPFTHATPVLDHSWCARLSMWRGAAQRALDYLHDYEEKIMSTHQIHILKCAPTREQFSTQKKQFFSAEARGSTPRVVLQLWTDYDCNRVRKVKCFQTK